MGCFSPQCPDQDRMRNPGTCPGQELNQWLFTFWNNAPPTHPRCPGLPPYFVGFVVNVNQWLSLELSHLLMIILLLLEDNLWPIYQNMFWLLFLSMYFTGVTTKLSRWLNLWPSFLGFFFRDLYFFPVSSPYGSLHQFLRSSVFHRFQGKFILKCKKNFKKNSYILLRIQM